MSTLRRSPRRAPAAASAIAAAFAVLGLAACSGAGAANSPAGNGQSFVSGRAGTTVFGARGPAAPAVSGKTLTGSRLSLSELRGHVVVLNFWGSWCTPCRAEAPALAALARRFAPRGVRFAGVDIRDSAPSAQGFDQDFGITYPSWNDPGDQIALAFRSTVPPQGIPTTLVISRGGRITARVVGEATYQGLQQLIASALAAQS